MAQITINETGTPITINEPGQPSTVRLNYIPPIDYSPVNYEGAINTSIQNLTSELEQGYYIGAMTYATQQKRGILIRRGTAHSFSYPSDIIKFETSDGGFTWTNEEVHTETDIDSRNLAGGNTSTGIIICFYGRYADAGWQSIRFMRSTDGGATWNHSDDLPLYPGVVDKFSPHGSLIEFENGTLKQTFYGEESTDVWHTWTLESTDAGETWGNPTLVATGDFINESDIAYLGNGRMIAVIRQDITTTNKDALVYNSDDYGETWSSLGKCTWGQNFDAPGTSPLLMTKDANSAYFIQNFRSTYNQMNESTLNYGTATITALTRRFALGNSARSGENLHYGYGRPIDFNGAMEDRLIAYYDLSLDYVSGPVLTDLWVGPIFRKQIVDTRKTSGTYAAGLSTYSPGAYALDEFPSYNNNSFTWQHIIREDATYFVEVTAVFTGNTTGTYRRLTVELWNSETDDYVSDLQEVQQLNTENSFSFSFSTNREFPDALVLRVEHDATGSLTVSNMQFKITKQ